MWNWFSSAPSYCEHLDQGDGTHQFFELNGSEGGSPLNESNHQALSQCQFGTNAACKSINWTNQLDFRTREKMVAKNMNINQQRNHNRRRAINNICNLILYEWSKWCLKSTRRRETKEYFVLYTNKHISWSCFNRFNAMFWSCQLLQVWTHNNKLLFLFYSGALGEENVILKWLHIHSRDLNNHCTWASLILLDFTTHSESFPGFHLIPPYTAKIRYTCSDGGVCGSGVGLTDSRMVVGVAFN